MPEPNPLDTPRFTISPATRTALIFGALITFGVLLTTFWVSKEALRIKRQRDATAAAKSSVSGDMVWVPAGKFTMGANDGLRDELPLHDVKVDGFWMDKTEVTNEQFERFVNATNYVTTAERSLDAEHPAGAWVFSPPAKVESLDDQRQWWKFTPGANWRHPEGPESDLRGREKHPVVQVSWEDAMAYCQWTGKRLPTEAEWEYAARGGLDHNPFVWGREKNPGGAWMANLWQGEFPARDTAEDGFRGTAPVASFKANGFGLHDMAGNVWEWCADWYRADAYSHTVRNNPPGPTASDDTVDPKRVTRGGSFLCADSYSTGYRPSARGPLAPRAAYQHTGFRCVRSTPRPY